MGAAEKTYSLAEYLALEAESAIKHEYRNGCRVAMAGEMLLHAQIGANLQAAFGNALRNSLYETYSSNARVAIAESNTYLYPDVTVACPPIETVNGQAIANPTLVIEVMSETSERYDRGEKFRLYRQVPALQQYLLVAQNAPRVEAYSRNSEGRWELSEAEGTNSSIFLPSLNIHLSLEDVYWKVKFGEEKGA